MPVFFYPDQRTRTLHGLGAAIYYADQRMRTLRGLGAVDYSGATSSTFSFDLPIENQIMPPPPDLGPAVPSIPQPISLSPAAAPALPPSFFTNPSPIIPATTAQPAPVAPNLGPAVQSPATLPTIVFPSGTIARPGTTPAPPATSWLDQQAIAGIPNLYLIVAAVGIGLVFSMSKRRR